MLEPKLLPRQAKDRMIEIHAKPLIMGVVNVTPDSFFDGGRYVEAAAAVAHAVRLVEEGADLLDIGAESTRPGADVVSEAEQLMTHGGTDALSSISFALKMNNLKVAASQLVVQIVNQTLLICGIMGYKNDSPFALGRHLRDAHSAALMVGNDRILATNASLLLVLKED